MTEENNNIVPGSPEHDSAMADKFDAAQGGAVSSENPVTTETQETPELILGKFKSTEDLAKAYQELQAKLGTQPENNSTQPENTQAAAEDAVNKAGLDFNTLSEEFATNGALSEDAYAKLDQAGIPKAIVDQYIAGQQALVDGLRSQAYGVAGGESRYQTMVGWAKANMSPDEITTFNQAVGSNNADAIKLAVMGLKARYESVNGSEPTLLGGSQGDTAGESFESWYRVREAMRDPRYAKDPAYRRSVEQKLGRSNPI